MNYETIADIYSANKRIRESLTAQLGDVSPTESEVVPDGEKWSVRHVAEHVTIVNHGIARICGKLVNAAKASGERSDGKACLTPEFLKQTSLPNIKLEAPDVVLPTGTLSIEESIGRLARNVEMFESLRSDMEEFDLSGPKFPHPYFGPMTAAEWLALVGYHEMRHSRQIAHLVDAIRKSPGQKEGDPTGVSTPN